MLNRKISIYASYFSAESRIATLGEFLFDKATRKAVDAIRSIEDKATRDEEKKKLPAATISGVFDGGHSGAKLVEHSGLMCIDVDSKHNPNINDWEEFKHQLSRIRFVAYAGLSISGRGIFAIIPIPKCDAAKHKEYFLALEEAFSKCGVVIDPNCKEINRLRGASYDDNYYLNTNAATFTKLPKPKPKPKPTAKMTCNYDHDPQTTIGMVESCVSQIVKHQIDMTDDEKTGYDDWLRLGFALSDLGEQGRPFFHAICQFYGNYSYQECDKKFTQLLKSRNGSITIGTFFAICEDYGIVPTKPSTRQEQQQERQTPPIETDHDTTAIVPTLADHPDKVRQMLESEDTITRCKALLFEGTFAEAMKEVEKWEKH